MGRRVTQTDDSQNCIDIVRTHDYDRYLAMLYAPADKRDALYAYIAFNAELARIPGLASEPMVGEIRLAWWREALADLAKGQVRGHPVLLALSEVETPPFDILEDMIEARIEELYREGTADLTALDSYGQRTHGALHGLLLSILKVEADIKSAATAMTYASVLKAMAYQALRQGQSSDETHMFKGAYTDETLAMAQALCEDAAFHIGKLKAAPAPKAAIPVLLPLISAQEVVSAYQAVEFDPRRVDLQKPALSRQFKFFWAALRGKI